MRRATAFTARRRAARLVAGFCLASLLCAAAAAGESIDYDVTSVKGKLLQETSAGELRLDAGAQLASGDRLRTGWRSHTDLDVPAFATRFEIGSRSRFELAADAPGILLQFERGRLRAIFDAWTGGSAEEERRIETPAAVLAVRGTEYGLDVTSDGATTLVVFSGVVDVQPTQVIEPGAAPLRVEAGYALHLRRGAAPGAPYRHDLSARQWDRGRTPGQPGVNGGGSGMGNAGSRGSMGSGGSAPRGSGPRHHG